MAVMRSLCTMACAVSTLSSPPSAHLIHHELRERGGSGLAGEIAKVLVRSPRPHGDDDDRQNDGAHRATTSAPLQETATHSIHHTTLAPALAVKIPKPLMKRSLLGQRRGSGVRLTFCAHQHSFSATVDVPMVLPEHLHLRRLSPDREAVEEEGQLGDCSCVRAARILALSDSRQGHVERRGLHARDSSPKAMPTAMTAGMCRLSSLPVAAF